MPQSIPPVQIIPLLDVVAAGNKHFAQAAAYLRRFRSDEYFPVRVQVWLLSSAV